MPAPTVVSSSPVDGETDVTIQKRLSIVFSTALKQSSVTAATLVLYESDGAVPVDGTISFSVDDKTVFFLPIQELRPSFSYTFIAVGASSALPAGSIQASTGESLVTTYSITFRTGVERFVPLEEVTDRTDIEHIAPIRESEELAEVTGVLSLIAASPEGFSTNNLNPLTITVQFDELLASGSFNSGWMVVEMHPILDYEGYLGGSVNGENVLQVEDESVSTDIPNGSVTVSADKLIWNRAPGGGSATMSSGYAIAGGSNPTFPTGASSYSSFQNDWPYNSEVTVILSPAIEGESGNKLGVETRIVFSTFMFPTFVGAHYLRLELGPAVRDLFDDTLYRIALKRSIEAWEIAGNEFNIRDPIYAAREYAKWGAILDIIEVLTVKRDMQAGTRKRLGDFEVAFDPKRVPSGREQSAREGLKKVEDKLRRWPRSLQARSAAVGAESPTGPLIFQGVRNWDNLITSGSEIIPAANWSTERASKKAYENSGISSSINPRHVLSVFYGKFQYLSETNSFYVHPSKYYKY